MSSRQTISPQTAYQVKVISQASLGFIARAAWSPDGGALAVAHGEEVSLWLEGFSPEPNRRIKHPTTVKSVAFAPDGAAFATGCSDMLVRLWSAVETFVLVTLRGHHSAVEGVAFSANGRLLASCSGDRTIRIVDMTDSIGSAVLSGHTSDVTGLAFNAAGDMLVSGGWDSTLRFWNVKDRSERAALTFADWLRDVVVSPSGEIIAAPCKDGSVYLVEFATQRQIAQLRAHPGGADCAAFSPDGAILATGGRDNAIRLWDWRSAPDQPLAVLQGHSKPVLTLSFHPVGTLLVSGGGDNLVNVWGVDGAGNT
ncbi:MAG: WD40 repeat domain-containing protein [Anaerolineae bacterium]|nr:WD40 repeat domain-containing protein [Anaerolineae bacterium]